MRIWIWIGKLPNARKLNFEMRKIIEHQLPEHQLVLPTPQRHFESFDSFEATRRLRSVQVIAFTEFFSKLSSLRCLAIFREASRWEVTVDLQSLLMRYTHAEIQPKCPNAVWRISPIDGIEWSSERKELLIADCACLALLPVRGNTFQPSDRMCQATELDGVQTLFSRLCYHSNCVHKFGY